MPIKCGICGETVEALPIHACNTPKASDKVACEFCEGSGFDYPEHQEAIKLFMGSGNSELLDMLKSIPSITLQPFRSSGFLNKECDMNRITIDLPPIEARKLFHAIQALTHTEG